MTKALRQRVLVLDRNNDVRAELSARRISLLLHDCTDRVADELERRGFRTGRCDAPRAAQGAASVSTSSTVTRRRGRAQRDVIRASRARRPPPR